MRCIIYGLFILLMNSPAMCQADEPGRSIEKYAINSETMYTCSTKVDKIGPRLKPRRLVLNSMKQGGSEVDTIALAIDCDQGGYPARWHLGTKYLDVITASAESPTQAGFGISRLSLDKLSDYDIRKPHNKAWDNKDARTVTAYPLTIAVMYRGAGKTDDIDYACLTTNSDSTIICVGLSDRLSLWITHLTEDLFLDPKKVEPINLQKKPQYRRLCCFPRPFKGAFDAICDGNELYVISTNGEGWKLNRPIDKITPGGLLDEYVRRPNDAPNDFIKAIIIEENLDKVFGTPDPDIHLNRVAEDIQAIVHDTKNNRSWWRKDNTLVSADTKKQVKLSPVIQTDQKEQAELDRLKKALPQISAATRPESE